MKILKKWIPPLAALSLCGCFQLQDELVLLPDGTGKVTMKLQSSVPDQVTALMNLWRQGAGGGQVYPPVSQAEAQRFFPAKDFNVKVEEKSAGDGKSLIIEADFKDVNALLSSAYGRAHQLALKTNANGRLELQALSGGSLLAQAAQFKAEGEMADFEVPGMEEAQKKKGEMSFAFRVALPNPVAAANRPHQGKSISWEAERAKCKDDETFVSQLSGVLEASCATEGIKFAAITPPRLGLVPFGRLITGKAAPTSPLPDTNKVVAAAKFVPYLLQVTRILDLSGEGSGQSSQAQLTGAISVPPELAPQRWGQAKLEEVVDAKGNSLMPKDESDPFSRMGRYESLSMLDQNETGDDEEESAPQANASEKPHILSLTFKAPEWKVKEIAKLKAVLELQYLGGMEVIKLTNAVPASLLMDMSKASTAGFEPPSDRGQLADSRLAELGLSLSVQMAMIQSGMTMLTLESSGEKAAIVDAQVFDNDGNPWPTTLMQPESPGGEDRSCQIMVAGKPKPPFSLALTVSGVGASVALPILLEKLPVGDK